MRYEYIPPSDVFIFIEEHHLNMTPRICFESIFHPVKTKKKKQEDINKAKMLLKNLMKLTERFNFLMKQIDEEFSQMNLDPPVPKYTPETINFGTDIDTAQKAVDEFETYFHEFFFKCREILKEAESQEFINFVRNKMSEAPKNAKVLILKRKGYIPYSEENTRLFKKEAENGSEIFFISQFITPVWIGLGLSISEDVLEQATKKDYLFLVAPELKNYDVTYC